MSFINIHKKNYLEKGTLLLPYDNLDFPLTKENIQELEKLCQEVDKEYISIGDAGEKNNLLVGRFMTDIEKPEVVQNPYSDKVIKILSEKKLINFIKKILDVNQEIFLRRIQFNQIDKNCFVGYHLDTDSNPDYIAAVVIQFSDLYKGGIYRVYQKDGKFSDFKSSYGDIIISNCKYPHEVTKVTEGERKSLVFFVSHSDTQNKRIRTS
jgi:predicted 2-oxoglutarate/Fe(II)-dependent dioxygenase YbiX